MLRQFEKRARHKARRCLYRAAEDVGEQHDQLFVAAAVTIFLGCDQTRQQVATGVGAPALDERADELHQRRERRVRAIADLRGDIRAEGITGAARQLTRDRHGLFGRDLEKRNHRSDACREKTVVHMRPESTGALDRPSVRALFRSTRGACDALAQASSVDGVAARMLATCGTTAADLDCKG